MKRLTRSPWFSLADLTLALICALAWAFGPQLGWVIFLIALFPWILRIAARQFPLHRTNLDLPVFIFLLTAGIGIWAAYDQAAAWEKFWWIVAAIRLYYALADQPKENFQTAATLIVATAALLSLQFLLTFDWQAHPLMGPVDRIGVVWTGLRPKIALPVPEPDFIGGLTAILIPLTLALTVVIYKKGNKGLLAAILTIGILLVLGLMMSGERPAWMGLFLAACLWFGWQVCTWIAERKKIKASILASISLLLLALSSLSLGIIIWQRYAAIGSMPHRLEEMINGIHLALEYPILGGGLTATPGLYSRYMLGIPYFFIPNLHNQYLDLAIECGFFGLGAVVVIFAETLFKLFRSLPDNEKISDQLSIYSWALALGIIILAVHSLVEDTFFSNWGLILFFTLPGLAGGFTPSSNLLQSVDYKKMWFVGLGLVVILSILLFRPLCALWQANIGAIEMSKGELQGWPDQSAQKEYFLSQLSQANTHFEKAIRASAIQPTANYRLGLIATDLRDFETANAHLETAFRQRPHHRGIQKALGNSYAWLGEIELAGQVLSGIPEAAYEMSIYAQWWASEDRPDLSDYATQTGILLETK